MDRQPFVLAGWIVAVFAVVGIGLGATGYVTTSLGTNAFGGGGSGSAGAMQQAFAQLFAVLIVFQGTLVVFFSGPLVAMVTGLVSGSILWDTLDAIVAGGLGAFVGFYLLVFLSVPLMLIAIGGGGGGGGSTTQTSLQFGKLVVPILVMGFPTGVVGAISAVVGNEMQ